MAETDIDIYGGHSQVNPAAVEAETRHHGQVCHRVVPHGGSHRPRGTHSHLGTFVAERRCRDMLRANRLAEIIVIGHDLETVCKDACVTFQQPENRYTPITV